MIYYVASRQLPTNVVGCDAHLHHEHHDVIGKIGDLVDRLLFFSALAGDDDLSALLADFFEYLVDALFKEVGGVGALFFRLLAAHQKFIEPVNREGLLAGENLLKEAGFAAGVAGRAVFYDEDDESVLVAVGGNGDDLLPVAAGFALAPELLAGAAKKAGIALFYGNTEALFVHVDHGEHLFCEKVLHDGGDEPLLVVFKFV